MHIVAVSFLVYAFFIKLIYFIFWVAMSSGSWQQILQKQVTCSLNCFCSEKSAVFKHWKNMLFQF